MKAFAARAFLMFVASIVSPLLFHVSACEAVEINSSSASTLSQAVMPESAEAQGPAEETATAGDLAEFAAIYSLRDGQGLKLIMAQRPRGRHAWAEKEFGNRAGSERPLPEAVYFRWVDGELSVAHIIRAESTLRTLVAAPLGISIWQVDGNAKLLDKIVPADIIWRPGASAENLVEAMNAAFEREFRMPVKLSLGEAEMDVLVAKGEYKYAQDPDAHDIAKARPLVIAAADGPTAVTIGLDGRGGLSEALTALADVIGTPVIAEATAGPEGGLAWFSGAAVTSSADVETVLARFTRQTNLTFTREKRKVHTLLVEKGTH